MYARQVNNKVLTFGVSGMLWNNSLVMYDRETGSLWSHLLGTAKQGPLRGATLAQVPSVITDWNTWSREHPEGTVVLLERTVSAYRKEFYRQLDAFVLGIAEGGRAKAWSFDQLRRVRVQNDTWQGQPVVVMFDPESVTARLYLRSVKDRLLTFELRAGKIQDVQTGTTWQPVTGRGVDGPLAGSFLEPLPAVVSYRRTWQTFHSGSK